MKKYDIYVYHLNGLRRAMTLNAYSAEHALQVAKRKGILAPIVGEPENAA